MVSATQPYDASGLIQSLEEQIHGRVLVNSPAESQGGRISAKLHCTGLHGKQLVVRCHKIHFHAPVWAQLPVKACRTGIQVHCSRNAPSVAHAVRVIQNHRSAAPGHLVDRSARPGQSVLPDWYVQYCESCVQRRLIENQRVLWSGIQSKTRVLCQPNLIKNRERMRCGSRAYLLEFQHLAAILNAQVVSRGYLLGDVTLSKTDLKTTQRRLCRRA